MKVASSALAGPNDAMAKSVSSDMLAILIATSRIGHQISQLYTIIHQLKRECNIDRLGEELGSAEARLCVRGRSRTALAPISSPLDERTRRQLAPPSKARKSGSYQAPRWREMDSNPRKATLSPLVRVQGIRTLDPA